MSDELKEAFRTLYAETLAAVREVEVSEPHGQRVKDEIEKKLSELSEKRVSELDLAAVTAALTQKIQPQVERAMGMGAKAELTALITGFEKVGEHVQMEHPPSAADFVSIGIRVCTRMVRKRIEFIDAEIAELEEK